MKFKKTAFIVEMKEMIDKAIQRLQNEKPEFEIYTASIWTDANAAVSSINFDSKLNSDEKMVRHNQFLKKYYDQFMAEGDKQSAELHKPNTGRNCNPADFELRNYEKINNSSVPRHWEERSDAECWNELDPALREIGDYAFEKIQSLKVHSELQLAVNGREDWYQFTWNR